MAEGLIRTLRSSLRKPVFEKVNADWLCELPLVIKIYIITFHNSIKITPVQTSLKE